MSDTPRPPELPGLARQHTLWSSRSRAIGGAMVGVFHHLMLFAIGAATVWAALAAIAEMVTKGHANVEDLLLLFIYLEIGAMVGIYFQTNHMPVRFLIYVGITALTRHLIDLVNTKTDTTTILIWSGSVLVLAVSVVALRYASFHYPSDRKSVVRTDAD